MQYHYTLWNGNGTRDPLYLAIFHRHALRTRSENTNTSIVVHCRYDEKVVMHLSLNYHIFGYTTIVLIFWGT